jgi:hypothetical protein
MPGWESRRRLEEGLAETIKSFEGLIAEPGMRSLPAE